ncbi:hypothetical protein GHK48_04055 [Sinorhizobium fredii]|uniref:Uncharacterized protein n=1 Tax=Rhizobium fredii TaxID=380 RepID=A0A844A5Z0_RHIFR|nr:hypothetical protein [Sinorhizobium fredii]MQX07512.1 hypothetical protein [Sinorhizobium fredii]
MEWTGLWAEGRTHGLFSDEPAQGDGLAPRQIKTQFMNVIDSRAECGRKTAHTFPHPA